MTGLIFKGVCDNAGHLEIEKKHAFGEGLFTLTYNGITYGDFYIGSKRSKSDYFSVSWQFVNILKHHGRCLPKRGKYVASTIFIAFHFMAMTKTNKFNDGKFHQLVVFSVGT